MAEFKDHFSTLSADYAKYRPTYPTELFSELASLCHNHELAWDAATGNGQAAHGLVPYFTQVIATDASSAQIANAVPHAKIQYKTMLSEKTDFPNAHFDLVTASTALHWFDFDTFYPELKRVLKPNGVFAAWCYSSVFIDPVVNTHVDALYWKVHAVWPKERLHVDAGYQDIPFPLAEIAPPKIRLFAHWELSQLIGYFNTWSGLKIHLEQFGKNSLDDYWQNIHAAWGDDKIKKQIEWKFHLRVGRNT